MLLCGGGLPSRWADALGHVLLDLPENCGPTGPLGYQRGNLGKLRAQLLYIMDSQGRVWRDGAMHTNVLLLLDCPSFMESVESSFRSGKAVALLGCGTIIGTDPCLHK